jgi:hypothetical protein
MPPMILCTAIRKSVSFHGYYDCYCYLPLYIFCDRHLLCAKLRPANIDASAGSREAIARIVARIRERWPKVHILLRAEVCGESRTTGLPARRFKDFTYRTLKSWSCTRRIVGNAEWIAAKHDRMRDEHDKGQANPRFVVTSLAKDRREARCLYEELYCARGEMENRIKECQLDLFADRTSAATMPSKKRRCIIPASGFFEWTGPKTNRQPWSAHLTQTYRSPPAAEIEPQKHDDEHQSERVPNHQVGPQDPA